MPAVVLPICVLGGNERNLQLCSIFWWIKPCPFGWGRDDTESQRALDCFRTKKPRRPRVYPKRGILRKLDVNVRTSFIGEDASVLCSHTTTQQNPRLVSRCLSRWEDAVFRPEHSLPQHYDIRVACARSWLGTRRSPCGSRPTAVSLTAAISAACTIPSTPPPAATTSKTASSSGMWILSMAHRSRCLSTAKFLPPTIAIAWKSGATRVMSARPTPPLRQTTAICSANVTWTADVADPIWSTWPERGHDAAQPLSMPARAAYPHRRLYLDGQGGSALLPHGRPLCRIRQHRAGRRGRLLALPQHHQRGASPTLHQGERLGRELRLLPRRL